MNDKIITLGKDWWTFPREYWGTRDRARAAAHLAEQQRLDPVVPPLHTPVNFSLHEKPSRAGARSRNVDEVLKELGIR
jgi:hypothetical protein